MKYLTTVCAGSVLYLLAVVTFLLTIFRISSALDKDGVADVEWSKTKIWGPGLRADFTVPVRYFYIQLVTTNGDNFTQSAGEKPFEVKLVRSDGQRVRVYLRLLDRKDGMYIVNYRIFETFKDMDIHILVDSAHIGKSPFHLSGYIRHESCFCPVSNIDDWYNSMSCPTTYKQIDLDLQPFHDVDLEATSVETVQRFNISTAHSLSRYKIINNKIYRKTYGEHVGFKMFSDAILLSLARKIKLPDLELFVNLGDWPLEKKTRAERALLPIFSWCGSDDSTDIVMPTYDLTEASLEMMGRQSLDIFHVMGRSPAKWEEKTEKGFWRGRDSRQERLDLVMMSRKYPKDVDAKMTRMFFFKHDEAKYGKLVDNVPFFDFFKHKYQVSLDGTVAAYRVPYLLAGDATLFKQDSNYYEHFYKELEPYVHYVPFERDLKDLREKIDWARENDDKVQEISRNAQNFALERLTPAHIFCYHVKLFQEYAQRLKSPPSPPDDTWDLVEQPATQGCTCDQESTTEPPTNGKSKKEEL